MQELRIDGVGRSELELPPDSALALQRCRAAVEGGAQLVWAEHCAECAMPGCFVTCSLYTPRPDLKCRRLARGIEPGFVRVSGGRPIPLMRVAFRRWGKLEARGYPGMLAPGPARALEGLGEALQALASTPGLPYGLVRRTLKPLDLARERLAQRLSRPAPPDGFVLEAINESPHPRALTLSIRPADGRSLFERSIKLASGYNLVTVPASEWRPFVDLSAPFLIQVAPQDESPEAITFGVLDLVSARALFEAAASAPPEPGASAKAPPAVKCVLWDLDNTLWSGTLIEDGVEGLAVNPAAVAAIEALDQRGVLHSILSKNTRADAEAALRRFGLWGYFLCPQIGWGPKSEGVAKIARQLNINADTFLFIDDQAFERAEIAFAHPDVETLDAADGIETLLDHPRLAGAPTAESARRRLMYMEDQSRAAALDDAGAGDSTAFLRQCDLKLELTDLGPDNIERVFELTERTNQLNYSGGRLGRLALDALMGDPRRLALVLAAADRFGDYGIIGFAVVAVPAWEVEHFFMSCRVQRKKIDHQFFQQLLAAAARGGATDLSIRYRSTARNAPSREVLEVEMGLELAGVDGDGWFRSPTSAVLPDTGIVRVIDRSRLSQPEPAGSAVVAG